MLADVWLLACVEDDNISMIVVVVPLPSVAGKLLCGHAASISSMQNTKADAIIRFICNPSSWNRQGTSKN